VRTTEAAVRKLIETDLTDISPFMEAAATIVDDIASANSVSESRLELIERWLSAHYIEIRDPRAGSESAGGVSQSFAMGSRAMYFESTFYGQQAMLFDTTGTLIGLQSDAKTGAATRVVCELVRAVSDNGTW
jgi:hypothetical protein